MQKKMTEIEQHQKDFLLEQFRKLQLPLIYEMTDDNVPRSIKVNLRKTFAPLAAIDIGFSLARIHREGFNDSLRAEIEFYNSRTHVNFLKLLLYFTIKPELAGDGRRLWLTEIREPQPLVTRRDDAIIRLLQREMAMLDPDSDMDINLDGTDLQRELRRLIKQQLRLRQRLAELPFHLDFFKPSTNNIGTGCQSYMFIVPVSYRDVPVTTLEVTTIVQSDKDGNLLRSISFKVRS